MDHGANKAAERKYALVERERRFLLTAVPDWPPLRRVEIVDRYLDGSRIRLRAATTVDGEGKGLVQYKLTQKLPPLEGGDRLITTLYLDGGEYRLFDKLPGPLLSKTRLSIAPFGVDVFHGPLAGLLLAEAEFSSDDQMTTFCPPDWLGPEVTEDTDFTGGRLARSGRADLRRALGQYGLDLPERRQAGS